MRTIIAGSRDADSLGDVTLAVAASGFKITEVVSGGARGADRAGERWAKKNGVPIKRFIPDWDSLGKRAGMIRNGQMARYAYENRDRGEAGQLVAVWDGKSRGTKQMIECARREHMNVFVFMVDPVL